MKQGVGWGITTNLSKISNWHVTHILYVIMTSIKKTFEATVCYQNKPHRSTALVLLVAFFEEGVLCFTGFITFVITASLFSNQNGMAMVSRNGLIFKMIPSV